MAHRICTVDDCPKPARTRGWCNKHYMRWYRTGDPEHEVRSPTASEDSGRFWSKVDTLGPMPEHRPDLGACWLWIAALDGDGYGSIGIQGVIWHAHRWAYDEQWGLPSYPEYELDHVCRVRSCVRPTHLEAVPHQTNMARGGYAMRARCGEGHEFTEGNIMWRSDGGRRCRTCHSQKGVS